MLFFNFKYKKYRIEVVKVIMDNLRKKGDRYKTTEDYEKNKMKKISCPIDKIKKPKEKKGIFTQENDKTKNKKNIIHILNLKLISDLLELIKIKLMKK